MLEFFLKMGVGLVVAWAMLFWAGRVFRRKYGFDPGYREIHLVPTADGGKVSLYRYRPDRSVPARPVILCHGLGANRFNFDLGPEHSLARTLQQAGFDVWSLDLRGRGRSSEVRQKGPCGYRRPCFFDDYVSQDAPAAISYVREQTGAEQVHWVGHSMGGMVLYGVLEGERASEIASGVAVASPGRVVPPFRVPFRGTARSALRLLPGLPQAFFARGLAPVLVRLALARPVSLLLNPANVERKILLRALCFLASNVTRGEILQFLQWADGGDLRAIRDRFSYTEYLDAIERPLLFLAGVQDRLAPPELVREVYERVSSRRKRFLVLGRQNGQRHDYGHGDLLLGKWCSEEVFPHILDWLRTAEKERPADPMCTGETAKDLPGLAPRSTASAAG